MPHWLEIYAGVFMFGGFIAPMSVWVIGQCVADVDYRGEPQARGRTLVIGTVLQALGAVLLIGSFLLTIVWFGLAMAMYLHWVT